MTSKMQILQGLLTLLCLTGALGAKREKRQAALRPFELNEVLPLQAQFGQGGWTGTWISNTEFTFRTAGSGDIYIFNMETLQSEVYYDGELLESWGTTNPIRSPDGEYLLIPSEVQQVFRYSTTARFALYNLNTGDITNIANHERLQLCVFDGVGHALAYVLDNNVFYQSPTGMVIQLTLDGIPGEIFNGHADWVYEEEVLYTGRALWFSPDGESLAFARFDDTEVETYSFYHYGEPGDINSQYPEIVNLKYPKVGRRNPDVSLTAVRLSPYNSVNLPVPVDIVTDDHILGSVVWPTSDEVAVTWLNRRQNLSALHICNITSEICETERIYAEPRGWIESSQIPRFSRDGDSFIELGWGHQGPDNTDAWRHLFQYNRSSVDNVVGAPLTVGRITVVSIVGWNEDLNYIVYIATEEFQPWRRQLYVTGLPSIDGCLSCDVVMPNGGLCGWASATASFNARFVSLTCQEKNEPILVVLINVLEREIVYRWNENLPVRAVLEDYLLPEIIIDTVELVGQNYNYVAPIRLFLPPGLNQTDVDTKYPMIIYVYSGPNTQTVIETFTIGYHSYMTTSRNVIYCHMDGRGSGLKGQDMLYEINNGLGSVEIEDHLIILRILLEKYPFIDESRIGMWGWSYGGYATALTLQQDTDNLLQCGVIVAPVTSWLYYDTIYTERYMGVPTEEDNLSGYLAGDVNVAAEQLRGKKFFLIHGNADDNVHYQNAMAMAVALQELNIDYDQMSYPDEAHALAGVTRHVYQAMDRFWVDCLQLQEEN